MRILILSDLHANLPATEAVLAHAGRDGWDTTLVLGDLVGYGADPAAVIDIVRGLKNLTVIRGNHDKVAAGLEDPIDFNTVARRAAEWTIDQLDADHSAYLRGLPRGPLTVDIPGIDAVICHGAPFDEDYYLFDVDDAAAALGAHPSALILCGHTHLQMAFRQINRSVARIDDQSIPFVERERLLVNPGSVGQPRDGDARAGYATIDTDEGTLSLHRVDYDIAEAQRRILDAGLHPALAERLSVGR